MAYIPEEFYQRTQDQPQNKYPVLITLGENGLPPSLEGKGRFVMADKIYSAQVSGTELQQLRQDNDIEAIEPDVEMHIL